MAGLLSTVSKKPKSLPPRIALYAGEKWGKTSFGAHCTWNPVFVMSAAETGLETLLEAGQIPPVDRFPEDAKSFRDLRQMVWELRDQPHNFDAAIFDTGNGAEKLCAEAVCDEVYEGSWLRYNDYGKGNEIAMKWWDEFIADLERLRVNRNMAVILLYHSRIKTQNNPLGKDFDQYKPECIDKLWQSTHKWADCIIYGGFKLDVKGENAAKAAKGKRDATKEKVSAENGQRYMRFTPSGPIVAGNRYGLPDEVLIPPGQKNTWAVFEAELTKARGAAGVIGRKHGHLPTLVEFTEIIGRKGRTYDQFLERCQKIASTNKDIKPDMLKQYGKIPIWLIEQYLEGVKQLPDADPASAASKAAAAAETKAAGSETETAKTDTKPTEKAAETAKVETNTAETETKPVEVKQVENPTLPAVVAEPAAETITAPVTAENEASKPVPGTPSAAFADQQKSEIAERDELSAQAYMMQELTPYTMRGLMNVEMPPLGFKSKDAALKDVPLPILRKFVEVLQQRPEVKAKVAVKS